MSTALEREIQAATSELRSEIVVTLQSLVRIPSQTGHEGGAQRAIAQLMVEHGFDVDVWEPDLETLRPYAEYLTTDSGFSDRPNVVGVWRSGGGGRSLILNGHMDTVAVGDLKAWKIDPFAGKVEKGRLYGRGACDMKGGLVANLFALRVLLRAGRLPSGNVILQSTVSEEDGGAGALAAVLRGYTADAALIAEPTDLSIVPAQGGSLMFRMSVPGLSAHACVRDEGVSAIEKFAFLHRGLLDLESRRTREIDHPLYDDMTNKAPINFGTIHGGTWPSTVPDEVIVEGRAGIVPGEDLEAFKIRFAQEVSDLARQDPWLRDHPPRLNWLDGQFAAAGVPLGDPLVTTLSSAVEAITEAPARIAAVTYGADMRHFIHAGRMPCVLFGAGDVRLAHAPNEWIAIDDLLTAIAITATFIAEWCGTAHSASS